MVFVESFDIFMGDFGQDVVIGPVGQQRTIRAIFDQNYHLADEALSPVIGTQPQITVVSSETLGIKRGDPVVINGTTFIIRGIHPDGTGVSVLELHKQ